MTPTSGIMDGKVVLITEASSGIGAAAGTTPELRVAWQESERMAGMSAGVQG